MDFPGANEDWDNQIPSFLPSEMNNCENEFFNQQGLLVSGQSTTATTAQSPMSGTNAPSLSPSGGSGTGTQTGALSPGSISQTSNTAAGTGACCENGRPIMTDPVSGQTVCSCQYDSARLALSAGYSRISTAGVSVYGTPYPSTEQNPYPSIGVDSSAFYSPLSNPYALKESGPTTDMSAWTSAGLQPTAGYYPYDPTLAAYGYGAGYDLAARRKNATRESTATLKAWLNEHKKNPYPTKGEKIMLAIITKMTLTQVSTWFANARRRLKKENKMTWEPKNKTDDDDDAMISDEEKDKDDMDNDKNRDHKDSLHHVKSEHDKDDDDDDLTDDDHKPENLSGMVGGHGHIPHHPLYQQHHHAMLGGYSNIKEEIGGPKNQSSSDCGVPIPASKPKIWSLADTAACKTPPPSSHHHLLGHPQQHQQQQSQHLQQHHHQQQHQQHAWMGNYHQQSHHHLQHQQPQHNTLNNPQNCGNGVGMMNTAAGAAAAIAAMNMGATGMNQQQHQQQQQHQMHHAQAAHSQQVRNPQQNQQHHQQQHQMNIVNNFENSPYNRYGGFPGASAAAAQMYQHTNNMRDTQQQNTHTTPTTIMQDPQQQQLGNTNGNPTHQQQQQQQQSKQHPQQQQPMGFPEIQTDTPPQTPPNMKLPSVAGNLLTGSTTPTTAICYNKMNNNSNNNNNNNNNNENTPNTLLGSYSGESSPSSDNSYMGNFTRIQSHSPSKDFSSQVVDTQDSVAAFKPFFKSQQVSTGFVSPV